jgi:hypothetical protein
LFHINLISLWISECNVSPLLKSVQLESDHVLVTLYLFSFPIATPTSEMLGSGTNGSAACIYVCLIPHLLDIQ